MERVGRIAAYVTSHGFGHMNRTVAVLNRIPADVPLTIRCHPDLFPHWAERLTRPADLEEHVSDAGAVNPPGDSAATDGPATLERAARVHVEAMARLDAEAARLADDGTAAVLCDAPYMPLAAAHRAGVPGYLLANFTWADIYAPHARTLGGAYPGLVREIRAAYALATAIFRAAPSLPMDGLAPIVDVGLVVNAGRDRRAELRGALGLSDREKLVYSYLGRYGQDGIDWARLARMADRGVHFVGFHPAPQGVEPPPNLHVIPAGRWTGADLAASTDAVVAKAGYGTVSEAMAAGTPLIYPPREGFAEHAALVAGLDAWGGGLPARRDDFDALRIEPLLDRAFSLLPGPPPFPTDGASHVAEHLTRLARRQAVA